MYIFDVLCATFCLLSLWCYASERWVLSFVAFWLAYKSKELAVMLPAVLLVFEIWFGKRRWKVLAPFFLASLSFGVQGMLRNPNRDNDYTFRFTAAALAKTSVFYAGRIFLIPYLGFVMPAFALLARNRRTWFGLGGDGAVSLPHAVSSRTRLQRVLLPAVRGPGDRHHGSRGGSVARRAYAVPGLWIPMDVHELRLRRRETLANDNEVRAWMNTVREFAAGKERVDAFVFSGAPDGFHQWGVEGALKYFYERNDLTVKYIGEADTAAFMQSKRVALLNWDAGRKRLDIVVRAPGNH